MPYKRLVCLEGCSISSNLHSWYVAKLTEMSILELCLPSFVKSVSFIASFSEVMNKLNFKVEITFKKFIMFQCNSPGCFFNCPTSEAFCLIIFHKKPSKFIISTTGLFNINDGFK